MKLVQPCEFQYGTVLQRCVPLLKERPLPIYKYVTCLLYPTKLIINNHYRCTSITILGTMYKPGCWLLASAGPSDGVVFFWHLAEIVSIQNVYYFIVDRKKCHFAPVFHGYRIDFSSSFIEVIHPLSLRCHIPFNDFNGVIKAKIDLHHYYSCV